MDKTPSAEERLSQLEQKFAESEASSHSSFQALLARYDLVTVVLNTVIASSPEAAHLAEQIYRRLTRYQNDVLFSADSTEAYRVAFEHGARQFDPAPPSPRAAR